MESVGFPGKDETYLSTKDVAKLTGLTPRSTEEWCARKGLTKYMHPLDGRRRLYLRTEVERAIQPRLIARAHQPDGA
jgi:Glu-tRNA(Gln) amidotransferase subunit E-like FAD-binding protein